MSNSVSSYDADIFYARMNAVLKRIFPVLVSIVGEQQDGLCAVSAMRKLCKFAECVLALQDITPTPDSECRIFMAYVPLDNAVVIESQQLETFERKGFSVVEWGGVEIKSRKKG